MYMKSDNNSIELSSIQRGVWIDQMTTPSIPKYNIGMVVYLEGKVDEKVFGKAIVSVCNKYDALRIILEKGDYEIPLQKALPSIEPPIQFLDYSEVDDPESESWSFINKQFSKNFNLLNSLLWETILIRVSINKFYWFSKFHHIICDGTGIAIFGHKVIAEYNCFLSNTNSSDRGISYLDCLKKEAAYYTSKRYENDCAFWAKKFIELPRSIFDSRSNSSEVNSCRSGLQKWSIDRKEFSSLMRSFDIKK